MFDMDISQIPLFSMLRSRLGYLAQRQQVISQNVANADTPGYLPSDLKPFTVNTQGQAGAGAKALTPVMTQPGHMLPPHMPAGSASGLKPVTTRDSETRLDGNSVVLEEEMMKLSDARTNYQAAIDFYEQSMSMIKTAAQAPK